MTNDFVSFSYYWKANNLFHIQICLIRDFFPFQNLASNDVVKKGQKSSLCKIDHYLYFYCQIYYTHYNIKCRGRRLGRKKNVEDYID